ncbi:hypothetical protein BHU72_10715 [Desulfuribacillus stibiiarsenatis]|uniref:Uncharacterized protein n=1 Tax=Desulfuribacillus stibiiarsenatis TaxID=1390249 RepID=A0A1E5L298_9FIRM|nr:hypothetical protein [Desulfuribacillus stibiiarsenatis]OEH84278.1 hypothetical protein BHU72_10715 [Desulfuribacillus stibiiarsenatis]
MKWQDVRNQYPEKWVLIEALNAESSDNRRTIKEMAVISDFTKSSDAWKEYKKIHLEDRTRELYIFHTCNEDVEVTEEKFVGIRSGRYN